LSTHPSSVRHSGRRALTSVKEIGEGEPLVLLHGLGTTRQIWSLVTEPLAAARRRVITLDLPAFGESAPVGRLLLAFAAADGATVSPGQARMMVEASAPAQRIAAATAVIAQTDLLPLLRTAPAPVGLLRGRQDRAVPFKLAAEVLAQRPDAELEVIDWTGHVPMVERPDSFALALDDVLRRLDKHATSSGAPRRTTP
jgi:pimeloyl-ACP methyl ester carboxylesterase